MSSITPNAQTVLVCVNWMRLIASFSVGICTPSFPAPAHTPCVPPSSSSTTARPRLKAVSGRRHRHDDPPRHQAAPARQHNCPVLHDGTFCTREFLTFFDTTQQFPTTTTFGSTKPARCPGVSSDATSPYPIVTDLSGPAGVRSPVTRLPSRGGEEALHNAKNPTSVLPELGR